MLRAWQVSQQYPSAAYPALGVMVQNAVRALAPLADVTVLAPRPYTLPVRGFPYGALASLPMRRNEAGVWVHRPRYAYLVPKSIFYPQAGPAMAYALTRYVAALPVPNLIHAHWSYPDGWAAQVVSQQLGVPLIVHARGTLERIIAKQSERFHALVSTPLRAADAVIANSAALREDCLELGVADERITVIPNGVDLELFGPTESKPERKRELGFDPSGVLALFCGNLRPVKGADLLAEAIPQLCAARLNLDFAVVGSGELAGPLARAWAGLLHEGRVRMPGALPQREVVRYMQAADLLIVPSRSEARGNVVLEALACQTAVAAARVGGIPELVDERHGVLFEPDSVAALVAAVTELTGQPSLLAQLGEAGRRFVLASDLTWHAHAVRTLALYREVCASRPAAQLGPRLDLPL
jgi:teichuronic acid biosynthesis glycosyltransferase TuaC